MEPDDREAVVTQAEHRIKLAVQRDADERWRNCMDKEDRITTNTIEALRSDVVTQRETERRSGTVAGSTGSGGSTGPQVVQNAFMASRIELKGGAAGETFAVRVLHWTRPNN